MSSTAATPQPCHLDRLPDELILDVLGLLVKGADQLQRRKVLLPLCRCSKRIGRLAQRMLWRHVRLQAPRLQVLDDDPLRRLVVSVSDVACAPSVVRVLEIIDYEGLVPIHLDLLAMALPGVRRLDLTNLGDVCLTHTVFFRELRYLALDKMSPFLSARRAPLVLPELVALTIRQIDLDKHPACALFFTSSTLPALRHLSIRACVRTSRLEPELHFPCLPSAFIAQLDDLQLDLEDQSALGEDHFPTTSAIVANRPILFHCSTLLPLEPPNMTSFLPVQHLQLDDTDWTRAWEPRWARLYLLPALRLVLVPTWVTSLPCSRADFQRDATVVQRTAELKLRGIELRLYDPRAPLEDGQLVVPEFADYLRETAAAAGAK